ncbi:MAG: hypothetical protein QMD80_00920 [archaeon]|nr:hypothetical protein [archaeon]
MEPDEETYFDSKRGIIFIRECLKCMECGEIMYTLKQTKEFQEKLKAMNLMGERYQLTLHFRLKIK